MRKKHSGEADGIAMAYNPEQLDNNVTSQRARKVAKRIASRHQRNTIRNALRKGIDAIDRLGMPRGHRFNGYVS